MSWQTIKLNEICDLQNGFAFKSSDYIDESSTLSCRMSNIRPGGYFDIEYNARYLPDEYIEKYNQFLLKDNDIVIAMTDLADSPKILGVPTLIQTNGKNILQNQRVGKLVILDSERIFFPYLKLVLNDQQIRSQYKKYANGGLQINLSKSDLLSIEILLPPLEEQKRIAAILDKADAIRQKRQKAIELADEFLRSVFLNMFGDPVTNPKGWRVHPLGDFITHANNGLSRRRATEENIGQIVLRLQDVHYDGIRFEKDLNRIDLDEKEKERYSLSSGDILFVRVNGNPEYVGRSTVFTGYKEPVYHNDHLIRLKVSREYSPFFLSYLLNMKGGRKIIRGKLKTSAGQYTVSQAGIESMQFMCPDIELQNKFCEIQAEIRKNFEKQNLQFFRTQNCFNSLSQKAFSGEL